MSPFEPWAQQPAMPPSPFPSRIELPYTPPKPPKPPKPPTDDYWGNLGLSDLPEIAALRQIMQPGWEGMLSMMKTVTPGTVGLGTSMGKAVAPAVGGALKSTLGAIPKWMGEHKLLTGLGGVGGYVGYQNIFGQSPAEEQPFLAPGYTPSGGMPDWAAEEAAWQAGQTPAGLPEPGDLEPPSGSGVQPQVVEIGGQTFWWNPTGGLYGTGGWDLIPIRAGAGAGGLTSEQQLSEAEAQRAAQMARLQEQYRLEMQLSQQEAMASRGQQQAGAAQQMSQMYAADPYKYWAQLGMGTPEAVARLTGGEIGTGEQFQQGVPLSTPSAQWWGNLLPSEQQQIMGGINWLGVDPQDYYSMYQRMIPGLGSRQMGPAWAR